MLLVARHLRGIGGLSLVAALCACGTEETPEWYCEQRAEHFCSVHESCCRNTGHPFDKARCKLDWRMQESEGLCVAPTDPSRFDLDQAGRCVSLMENLYDGCRYPRHDSLKAAEAQRVCRRVDLGAPTGPQDPCAECRGPPPEGFVTWCEPPALGDVGSSRGGCGMLPIVGVGIYCGDPWTIAVCEHGLRCVKGTCVPRLADDATCEEDVDCASGHCTERTCAATGDPLGSDSWCRAVDGLPP